MSVDELSPDTAPVDAQKRGSRWRTAAIVLLAGPLAIISATLVMMAMPLWYPPGPAKIDNIVVPLLIFPLIWAVLFFHALLDQRLLRVTAVTLAVGGVSALMITLKMLGMAFQA
ncbi:MAG: hypothetical protein AAF441_13320 [Pseudomonadota bacterium]